MHLARPRPRRLSVLAMTAVGLMLLGVLAPGASADEEAPLPSPPAADGSTVIGELVRAWPEHATVEEAAHVADTGPLTWVESADGSSVRLPTDDTQELPVGATVSVTVGTQVPDAPAEDDGLTPAREVLSASVLEDPTSDPAVAAAPGVATNFVTVVRVVPSGGRADSMAAATLTRAVNGPVASFWRGQSGGRIQLGVIAEAPDWVYSSSGCSDPAGLWASAASAVGWSAAPGRHLLVYVSSLPQDLVGCSYGMAEVGTSASSGGRVSMRSAATAVLAHELGHNFGLGHSSAVQCDGRVDDGTCATAPYRDLYDVMGSSWSQLGSLNAAQADRLGVLGAADTVTLQPSAGQTNVSLAPMASGGGTRAARLVAADGSSWWVEYRAAVGQDSWIGGGADVFQLQAGVQIRRAVSGDDTSLLLDGSPSARSGWDTDRATVVPVGSTVSVAGGDFRIAVQYATASEALITIAPRAAGTAPIPIIGQQLPVGNWEVLTASGSTLTVAGWAMDPDSPSVSGQVHVYVDGGGTALVADGLRPDVGAAFPGAGDRHGFSLSTVLSPGVHTVCAYAIDVEISWRNMAFGCRTITTAWALPTGNWEVLAAAGPTVSVAGWALDPDSPSASVEVHLYIDGGGTALVADSSRPDVGAVFPGAGDRHGFSATRTVAPGVHTACAYLIDQQAPGRNTPMGCRTIATEWGLPTGNWEVLAASGSTLSVAGWAMDPDSSSVSGQVHVYVDGGGTALVADGSRPDVGAAFPGAGDRHGFSSSTRVAAGLHTVCAYAIDQQTTWRNTPFGCRTVRVTG